MGRRPKGCLPCFLFCILILLTYSFLFWLHIHLFLITDLPFKATPGNSSMEGEKKWKFFQKMTKGVSVLIRHNDVLHANIIHTMIFSLQQQEPLYTESPRFGWLRQYAHHKTKLNTKPFVSQEITKLSTYFERPNSHLRLTTTTMDIGLPNALGCKFNIKKHIFNQPIN